MKVRAPHGSCFSGRKKSTPAAWNSANRARISAALSTVIEADRSSSRSRMSPTKTGSADQAQVQQRLVAPDLAVEGRLAVGEDDLEAELSVKKAHAAWKSATNSSGSAAFSVGVAASGGFGVGHGLHSCFERLPALEPGLAGHQLLRIGELEALLQDLAVAEVTETRQDGPDLRGDGIVAVTMPAQIELGLLAEVLEVGHGRSYGSRHVGGHGPFGRSRCALQQRRQGCAASAARCQCQASASTPSALPKRRLQSSASPYLRCRAV